MVSISRVSRSLPAAVSPAAAAPPWGWPRRWDAKSGKPLLIHAAAKKSFAR